MKDRIILLTFYLFPPFVREILSRVASALVMIHKRRYIKTATWEEGVFCGKSREISYFLNGNSCLRSFEFKIYLLIVPNGVFHANYSPCYAQREDMLTMFFPPPPSTSDVDHCSGGILLLHTAARKGREGDQKMSPSVRRRETLTNLVSSVPAMGGGGKTRRNKSFSWNNAAMRHEGFGERGGGRE